MGRMPARRTGRKAAGRGTGILASEQAGIGLPWARMRAWGPLRGQHRLDLLGSCGGLVGGAALVGGVFLFPVYLSRADRQVLRSCLSQCAESTGSGPKLYHREAREGPFCYDQGLFFQRFSLFSHNRAAVANSIWT